MLQRSASSHADHRICWLLDHWIQLYPNDFAVPGTAGALSALIKSIVGKTYLLHYGSEFIPFMEVLSTLKDQDSTWAMKVDEPRDDSDDSISVADPPAAAPASPVSSMTSQSLPESIERTQDAPPPTMRERKASLPLSTKISMMASPTHVYMDGLDHSLKGQLKALVNVAQQVLQTDPTTIAHEITRVECKYFLQIQVCHLTRPSHKVAK